MNDNFKGFSTEKRLRITGKNSVDIVTFLRLNFQIYFLVKLNQ